MVTISWRGARQDWALLYSALWHGSMTPFGRVTRSLDSRVMMKMWGRKYWTRQGSAALWCPMASCDALLAAVCVSREPEWAD